MRPLAHKRSVTLSIAGHTLSIRSDKDSAYLRELAAYLNQVIEELQGSTATSRATTHQVLLLAALNVTDELFQAQDAQASVKHTVEDHAKRIIRTLDGVPPS